MNDPDALVISYGNAAVIAEAEATAAWDAHGTAFALTDYLDRGARNLAADGFHNIATILEAAGVSAEREEARLHARALSAERRAHTVNLCALAAVRYARTVHVARVHHNLT